MSIAVDRFRRAAQLHLNSPDDALVKYAHGAGRDRPGADIVRSAMVEERVRQDDLARSEGQDGLFAQEGGARTPSETIGQERPARAVSSDTTAPDAIESTPTEPETLPECPHPELGRLSDGDRFCEECGLVFESSEPKCDHIWSGDAMPGDGPVRVAQRCVECEAWRTCDPSVGHVAICDNGTFKYCTRCGEIVQAPKTAANFEVVDHGVSEVRVHSPMLEDVDEPEQEEIRRKTVRRVDDVELDEPDDANEYENDEEILF